MNVLTPVVTSTPIGLKPDVQVNQDKPVEEPVNSVEPAKEDPQSQESFSKRFSALNRERKSLSQKEVELKKQMAQIEVEKAEIAKWRSDQEEIKRGLNPLKALEMHGYKYDDAAKFILNDEQPTADLKISAVQQQVEDLKKQLAEKDKLVLENEKSVLEKHASEQNQQAIGAIKTHLEAKPEFDALIALGMHEDMFDKINDHYQKTGEVLKIDDVAAEMLLKVEEMLGVVTKTNIYKTKFAAQQVPIKTPPKTLSNSLHSQTAPPEKRAYKTDEERVKNALALLSK